MAEKTTSVDNAQEKDELVLEDNQLVCALTNKVVKATDKELTLQSMIDMMAEEYGFAPEDMERDFRVTYKEPDSDKSRAQAVDLAIFDAGKAHVVENLIRFVVVAKDAKVKPTDAKKGVDAMLDNILTFTDCKFGCWTNGEDLHYRYYTELRPKTFRTFLPMAKRLPTLKLRATVPCRVSRPMSRLSRHSSAATTTSMAMRV